MKAQDATRRDTLRLILAAIHNVEVEQRGRAPDEAAILGVLQKQAKMRREAIEAYEKGGRRDLADRERAELTLIESYLPRQLDRDAIAHRARAIIIEMGATSPREQGAIMKRLMPELRGQADGKLVAEVVNELLAKSAR
jgi:uncharacterized protein YqeY